MATTEVEQSGGESKIPKYSYLNIVPDVLIQTPQSNNAIAMDAYSHYVYIAGTEGIVRKYNFHDSISGKVALTQNQKHGLIDLVNKRIHELTKAVWIIDTTNMGLQIIILW